MTLATPTESHCSNMFILLPFVLYYYGRYYAKFAVASGLVARIVERFAGGIELVELEGIKPPSDV
jgi:hypothetical protein